MKKKNEIKEKDTNKKEKRIIVIIFALLFCIGLFLEKDVGFYSDELTEQNILRSNVIEYAELFGKDNDIVNYYNEQAVIPISQNVEKDHGVAPYLAFVPLLIVGKFSAEILSILWHVYTYILFFLGVIMVYKISYHFFKDRKISLLNSLVLMFSPRMFADGLYNNKDIVLMSLVLGIIYFGIRFIENKDYKDAIILGIVSAFAFNVKIIGIFVFGIFGIFYLIQYIMSKKEKILNKDLYVGLTAIAVFVITFIIITPAVWGSGFDLIGYMRWCLTESTKFSRWNGSVLFEGKVYSYAMGESLPTYYLPKMILITTPPYIIALFLTGVFFIGWNYFKKKDIKINNYFLAILLCMIIPILVGVITHTKLYNGWRHFYFIYGSLVLVALYGIYNLRQYIKNKKLFYTILVLFVSFYTIGSIYYGVNSTAYYNIIVNHEDISKKYELDYYGPTAKRVLADSINKKTQDKVYVYSDGYGFNVLENNYLHLSKMKQQRMEITKDIDYYNQLKEEGKEVYKYYNSVYNSKELIKGMKKVYSRSAWGNDVSALYK